MSHYFNIILILIFSFFNIVIVSAQSNQYNLTNTCQDTIDTISQNEDIDKCLSFSEIIITIPTMINPNTNPIVKLSIIAQNVKTVCHLPKCNINTMKQIAQSVGANCGQDLKSKNLVAIMAYSMFAYYEPLREIVCLESTSNEFNGYCILETITNFAKANQTQNHKRGQKLQIDQKREIGIRHFTSSTSPPLTTTLCITSDKPIATSSSKESQPSVTSGDVDNPTVTSTTVNETLTSVQEQSTIPSSTVIPTYSLPATDAGSSENPLISFILPLLELPSNLLCTDCNKAMLSVLFKYVKENPSPSTSFNSTQIITPLNSKCGASFTDGYIPNTISTANDILASNSFIITSIFLTLTFPAIIIF